MRFALTMPWYTKLVILGIDVMHNLITPNISKKDNEDNDITTKLKTIKNLLLIYALFLSISVLCLLPSLIMPVVNRIRTNQIICEMLSMLTLHIMLFNFYNHLKISTEELCYIMQFCCTYFYFYLQNTNKQNKLLGTKFIHTICSVSLLASFLLCMIHTTDL